MRGLTWLVMLVTLLTTACTTPMIDREASKTEERIVKRICSDAWKPTPYDSKRDTQETIDGNRANNRARDAFCNTDGETDLQ